MARLLLVRALAKVLGPVGIGATAFYMGTQNSHVVDKLEHNLLRSHMEYAEASHRGSLGVVEVENDNGQLEKRLKNQDTGDIIYTIRADCLPDNDFIYQGLAARAESSSPTELREMREHARYLEALIEGELYKGVPVEEGAVNPLKLRVHTRENVDGELEAVLCYGDRAVPLTRKDFDYLARNCTQLASEIGLSPRAVHVSRPSVTPQVSAGADPGGSGTSYLTYGVLGALSLALIVAGYRLKKNYQFND